MSRGQGRGQGRGQSRGQGRGQVIRQEIGQMIRQEIGKRIGIGQRIGYSIELGIAKRKENKGYKLEDKGQKIDDKPISLNPHLGILIKRYLIPPSTPIKYHLSITILLTHHLSWSQINLSNNYSVFMKVFYSISYIRISIFAITLHILLLIQQINENVGSNQNLS